MRYYVTEKGVTKEVSRTTFYRKVKEIRQKYVVARINVGSFIDGSKYKMV